MACFWWRRPSRGKTVVTFVYCLFFWCFRVGFGGVLGGVGGRCNSVLWPALSITISCVGNRDGRTLAPACFKRLPKSWMRLSSLDDKCSASLAIENMARRSVLKPEKLKKNTKKIRWFCKLMNAENIAKRKKKAKTHWHGECHQLKCVPKPCVWHPMSIIWTPRTDITWVQFPTRRDV